MTVAPASSLELGEDRLLSPNLLPSQGVEQGGVVRK
jgi:hypothetical protein